MSDKNPDELGALWEKTGARGTYMTGNINGVGVVVFHNDKKAPGSKQPDWRVLVAKKKEDRNDDVSAAVVDEDCPF